MVMWCCGCSMGYFSTQSGWWSFIRVPMVVEWLVVGGAVVVVWVISVPRVVGGGWGCGCSMGYFSTQSVGGGWGCGCSMGYFSPQSGWW